MKHRVLFLALLFFFNTAGIVKSARFENKIAEFAGMDKITGRILRFDVDINRSVQFGSLKITPMVCYSRDDKEIQRVDSFVSISEISTDHTVRSIFSGWMFADSPAMNAIDHSIYDVWLIQCKNPIKDSDKNSTRYSIPVPKMTVTENPDDNSIPKASSQSIEEISDAHLDKNYNQKSENNLNTSDLDGKDDDYL